jgi:glycosyltransferase involved in cell wall biosynthesis
VDRKSVRETEADYICWDEPHYHSSAHFSYDKGYTEQLSEEDVSDWSCYCDVCRAHFKEEYGHEMPRKLTREVSEFRINGLKEFLVPEIVRCNHHQNSFYHKLIESRQILNIYCLNYKSDKMPIVGMTLNKMEAKKNEEITGAVKLNSNMNITDVKEESLVALNCKGISIEVRDLGLEEKRSLYLSSDVFLYPAVSPAAIDPPLTVLEAMSCGCTVVASDTQSLPTILSPGRGLILDHRNIRAGLVRAISLLRRDPARTRPE